MEVQRIISNDKNTENLLTQIKKEVSTRLPLHEGEFKIYLYKDRDDKAHLALVMGKVSSKRNVLVRIHSECLTGDVFGSIRCDCGEQLDQAIKIIAEEGTGILLYLRQEGRGIGLAEKLHSYNLQDKGYDTVDANLVLGHSPDERDFGIAASILKDLGVDSIRLLSNNPSKFKPLIDVGINITNRISLKPRVTSENKSYLMTKISRMNHILDIEGLTSYTPEREAVIRYLSRKIKGFQNKNRPFITLAYAQSLDGCISVQGNQSIKLSSKESLILTHQIRAIHDSILVGIGTVISDNPKLNVRLTKGRNPQPVILDSKLRIPLDSKLVENSFLPPWIVVGEKIDKKKRRTLENQGAKIFQMPLNEGRIDLSILLPYLKKLGIKNIMVEGGANIISSFIKEKLVDAIISTITPYLIGNGFHALSNNYFNDGKKNLFLKNCKYVQVGRDLIVYGTPSWKNSGWIN